MEIFIEAIDCDIWDAVVNGPFVPTHRVNDVMVNKPRSLWTKDEKEKVQYNLKAKNIITTALSIDEFYRVSHCKTAKEMWDALQVTHEGTTEVKRARMNTLTYEYELFRMKPSETIQELNKRFIHIVNHLKGLGKSFKNEDLINKVLRCLNRNWQPKVTAISESKDLSSMDLYTLFGKLQEHELELNRLKCEEGEKKKKGVSLKASTKESDTEDSDSTNESDEDMTIMVQSFKKFMRHKGKQKQFSGRQKKNEEGASFNPTCHKCGKKGHIKLNCPRNQKYEKFNKNRPKESKGRRAYITWDKNDMESSGESGNEEANLCFMGKHKEDEVNSFETEPDLTYDELLSICEELNNESTKLRKIVSTSKKTISSLQAKIETLNKEIEILKENQIFVSEVSSCNSYKNQKENIPKCEECNLLKNKVDDLHNSLAKFTMGRGNLNIILGNQRGTYDKAGLGYQPKIHEKSFKKFFGPNNTSSSPFVKCFYCGRRGHTSSICNARKNRFMEGKNVWIPKHTLPKSNIQGPKMVWVPKAKN